MKTLGLYVLTLGFLLMIHTGATAQETPDERIETTITQIQGRIIQLEHQLTDLKMVDKKSLSKAEKRHLKLQKRALRQALAAERNVLNRLTRPEPMWFGPYGPAYYTAFGPWGYWDPFLSGYPYPIYPVRRIYVNPNRPAPQPPKNAVPDRTPRRPDTPPPATRRPDKR